VNKCLKEWNPTIEALGHGKQIILIRSHRTNLTEFLLYPTVNYALKDYYLDSFQEIHQEFVAETALPGKNGDKVLVKYYATLEKIVENPVSRLPSNKYYIWTRNHVKNYMTGKNAFIWVLRVYILREPYWAEPSPGAVRYANLKREVTIEGIEPVLSDIEFSRVLNNIK